MNSTKISQWRFYLFSATFPDDIWKQSRSRYRAFSFLNLQIISIFSQELIFERRRKIDTFRNIRPSFPCIYASFFKIFNIRAVDSGVNRFSKTREKMEEMEYLIYTVEQLERKGKRYFKSEIKLLKYERILITTGRNYLVSYEEREREGRRNGLMIKDKYDGGQGRGDEERRRGRRNEGGEKGSSKESLPFLSLPLSILSIVKPRVRENFANLYTVVAGNQPK